MLNFQNIFDIVRLRIAEIPRAWVFGFLLVWTLAVRLPFAHVLADDEAFFSVVANRWLHGELPYVSSYDIKAPGIFALFALVQSVFGSGLAQIKGLEIIFVIWGAYSLYRLVTLYGSPQAGLCIALLYPLYSLFQAGVSFPCQIVQMALTIQAFSWALQAESTSDRRAVVLTVLSGLVIGCAVMIKQTAAFEGLALYGWLAWRNYHRRNFWSTLSFCAVAVLPTLGFGIYFAMCGHLKEAFDGVVMSAFQRSQIDMTIKPDTLHLGVFFRLTSYPALVKPILIATAGALLAVLRWRRLKSSFGPDLLVLSLLWYVAASAGILIVKSPALYCGFPLMAPTLILFCLVLNNGIDFAPKWRVTGIICYLVVASLHPFYVERDDLFSNGYKGIPDYTANILAARSLQSAGIQPGDNLLVLSRGHYAYLFTQTLPKAKYFNAMHLLCDFPTPDKDPLGMAFDSRPQYILMSDTNSMISCYRQDRLDFLTEKLGQDYVRVSSVHGTWDSFGIYGRRIDH